MTSRIPHRFQSWRLIGALLGLSCALGACNQTTEIVTASVPGNDYKLRQPVAGPCGLWPEDLGPNIDDPGYNENRPYHNFGCSTQRNLAAMIDNPADLEQPRPETPAYTPRRDVAFDRYRKGTTTTTIYPEAEKAKLSDSGK